MKKPSTGKNPSRNLVISFRLNPSHLAKAIDGLQRYNPNFMPERLSEIAKETFLHGLNYLTTGMPFEPSQRAISILQDITIQSGNKLINLSGHNQDLSAPVGEIPTMTRTAPAPELPTPEPEPQTPSESITESTITSVSNFDFLKELTKQLNDLEE